MIVGGVGAAIWLLATGQAGTVDGLFLLLTALLLAGAFALYVMFMIRRAMEAVSKPVPQAAKAGAGAAAKAPAAVTQA